MKKDFLWLHWVCLPFLPSPLHPSKRSTPPLSPSAQPTQFGDDEDEDFHDDPILLNESTMLYRNLSCICVFLCENPAVRHKMYWTFLCPQHHHCLSICYLKHSVQELHRPKVSGIYYKINNVFVFLLFYNLEFKELHYSTVCFSRNWKSAYQFIIIGSIIGVLFNVRVFPILYHEYHCNTVCHKKLYNDAFISV